VTENTEPSNEVIELEGQESLDSNQIEDVSFSEIEVRISKVQFSIYELLRNIEREKIILAPNFQRHDVWNMSQRSELIESILINIPIPLIYLFEDKRGIKQVVDGKQRLTAFERFCNNDFSLAGLKIRSDLNGLRFNELTSDLQARIEDYQIHAYMIQPPTPESIKFHIFDRVNRAGTQLNKQEMRHALYQGRASQLLERLSETYEFKKATGNSLKIERMRDRYAVLRCISFYLLYKNILGSYQYKSNIDDFMAYVMEFINTNASDELINEIENVFIRSMAAIYEALGEDAFRFDNRYGTRRPINVGLIEMLAFVFQDGVIHTVNIDKIKNEIKTQKEYIDSSGLFDKGASSKRSFEFRAEQARDLRNKIINNDN
jgi:hypothetical protein